MSKEIGWRCVAVFFSLICVFFVYRQGLTGAIFYDDYGNLEGLSNIADWSSAKMYILNGIAGPLGRPIALTSFALQAHDWPANSYAFLLVNVLLHLSNAILLGALGYLCIGISGRASPSRAFWISFLAASLWVSLPLLASTTLIVVQRMTGLAAFFSILGLIGYTWAYRFYLHSPVRALFVQMSLLGLGTMLAMLSKENGALTPLYALAINTLVKRDGNASIEHWADRARSAILFAALLAFLIYLSPLARDYFTVSDVRGYSPWQRLQVEIIILWDYLRALVAPIPSLFGPFHDDYSHVTNSAALWFGIFGWLGISAFAVWLLAHGYTRWMFFGLLWFLLGHLLESTTILLELYFEHRNYLPAYGLCLALAVGVMSVPRRYRPVTLTIFVLFLLIQLLVLFSVTSTWGDKRRSAELWAAERPASSRAVTHAVFLELSDGVEQSAELNYQYIRRQRYQHALDLLDRTIKHCPSCVSVRLQAIAYACQLQDYADAKERLGATLSLAPGAEKPRAVVDSLFALRELIKEKGCGAVDSKELLDLIKAISKSQLFEIDHISARLYFLAAALAEDIGHRRMRDEYLVIAEAASPIALPVLQYQVNSALKELRYDVALQAIDRRYAYVESNTGAMKEAVLDDLRALVLDAMRAPPDKLRDTVK
jgi:tetratricopeptide (TPR) repeat protein